MTKLLDGKTVFITGTNRGIGKELVKVFASYGADVVAHARSATDEFENDCQYISESEGVRVIPVYFDLNNYDEIKKSISEIRKNCNINVLVNNAGTVGSVNIFQMTSIEDIKKEFEVNFFSQMYLTQLVSRCMGRNGGSIINITACAAMDAYSAMLPYVSSKSAMVGATKRLAIEFGRQNIRVNSIAPGLTETDMGNIMTEDLTERTLSHVIMGRKAKAEEIANSAVFLASDLSSYITGQIIRVDGGMLL